MGHYVRLSAEERELISCLLFTKISFRQIGMALGRSASTISREVRGYVKASDYIGVTSHKKAAAKARSRRFGKRKLTQNSRLLAVVKKKLELRWSPEQIAEYLKSHYKNKSMHVSGETIYSYIYVFLRREMREEFTKHLRNAHKKRRTRGKSAEGRPSKLEEMTSIEERPAEVTDRLIPGHWEGDLMIGGAREQTALGTLVERTTRFAILVPLKGKSAEEVRKEFAKEIKKLPKQLRLSLTYDQGREMAQHKLFTKETQMKVYFAHPRSPWERGTNENTNGLIRQYFPKGTNFKLISRQEIKRVQRQLNERPRKTLGFKTPAEKMADLLR